MSVSMTRKDGRHFFQINPQLQTLVQSVDEIKAALEKAPKEWWKYHVPGSPVIETVIPSLPKQATSFAAENDETDEEEDDMLFQTASS